jgi:hypothetical protein
MEKNDFEGKWKQIRSHSKIWWNLINDSDLIKLDQAKIKYFEFVIGFDVIRSGFYK